ncbi:MAG: oligopeptide/dipeptide ABC transporter ATP-binding protein [Bacilli bacterium]
MAEKKLEVKNLTISFKTDNGLVQAVRNVSFDLGKEETLCIVGESGSGKSVTSKAIMGILANNAIVEDGEIIYEGENLLEVSEEEYHKIRGNKIGMIFQDPLSSLNPIVRIGKQITEAMLINSNKVKKMYEEKISKELVAYKNVIARKNIKIKKAKDEYALTLKRAQKDNPDKETLSKIKKEASSLRNQKIQEAEKECSEVLPSLKKALDEKKQQAKKEVNEYKSGVKETYKPIRKENISKLIEAVKSRDKEKIKEAKDKYIADRDAYLDQIKITKKEAKRRALEIMGEVGIPLPEKRFRQYPFEFSGGMRQRIVIAIALTAAPEILICDEPTTALDVTIQAQILELIKKIQKERHISCIFITHDLGVVANMADRVAVMYAGKIVECGTAEEIFYEPKHPYTWALLASIPDIDSKERLEAIPGTPPDMIYPPKGDAFALRSKYAMKIDFEQEPPMFKISDTHYAATWLLHPDAPKVKMPKIVETRIKNALKESKQQAKKEGATNEGK